MVQFGVYFGNSNLDNSNWDKISDSLIKNHTHVRKMVHTSEFAFSIYWWTLKNPKKSDFWTKEKICWRYHHFTHVSQKPQSYKVQFLRYEVRQSFSSFWAIFCPFNPLPLNNPKNQNFGGMKKEFGDVIILNLCNKKHDHMMYAYSDMERSHRHIFLSFEAIIGLLPHYWPPKSKFGKNLKNTRRYYPFTHVYH